MADDQNEDPTADRPVQLPGFKSLPNGPQQSPNPLRHFSQVRNLSDKQFGQIQVPTPERRFTPPGEQFSAWGASG